MKEFFKIFLVVIFIPTFVFAINEESESSNIPAPNIPAAETTSSEISLDDEDGKQALSGEIELEFEKKKINSYKRTQNSVIKSFKEVKDRAKKLALKESVTEGDFSKEKFVFSDRQLLYIASSYLYCVSKKGTCPYLLDALLEVDFFALCNSKEGVCQRPKKVACANMTRMWKIWIDNDLEQRLSHNIPIGLMGKYNDFKQDDFSKYLKCSRTLLPRIKKALKDDAYLSKEYSDNNEIESFSKTIQYLEALKANVVNIITLQGIE